MIHDTGLGTLQKWAADVRARGLTPPNIVEKTEAFFKREGWVGWCEACGFPVLDPALADGDAEPFMAYTHRDTPHCEKCEAGEPGHTAYHRHVELAASDAHSDFCQDIWDSHRAIEEHKHEQHRKCPWAARGETCCYGLVAPRVLVVFAGEAAAL